MTYHISQIINKSSKSVAIVNQHSSPDGRDSRILETGANFGVPHPIEISHLTLTGTIPYSSAAENPIQNVYTSKDNWFFWDNGRDALNGVREATPDQNDSLYKGQATNLILTIDNSGQISFTKAP
jgi:hypothetical protein